VNRHERNCDCSICSHHHEFDLTNELLDDLISGNVTLFAGAGISTESRAVLKHTFREEIAAELGPGRAAPDFPALMEEYCQQPNGRLKLLQAIKKRFDHVDSFPELEFAATSFHRELGTFFPLRNIITTNWDTYFERHCWATPFVTDSDLAFWQAADRRVLKIHGSISNFGSIVATTTDYAKCKERLDSGIIGGILKTTLATQTVVFVGYALSDSDFIEIYEFVKKQMRSLHRQAYVVTPFQEVCERFAAEGLIPIRTDGTFFVKGIKGIAVTQGAMLDDCVYDEARDLLSAVSAEHALLSESVKNSEVPEVIFALSYQDGMMHALERAIEMKGSGKYSDWCRVRRSVEGYLELKRERLSGGEYGDVAYIEGYINGLMFLLMGSERQEAVLPPMYFAFGVKKDIFTLSELLGVLTGGSIPHKAARRMAVRHLSRYADQDSIVIHHPPWL
jgi:hypothetical protein